MLTFNSIDVETANADRASICQIGMVHVRDGQIEDRWQTLVNPEDWFDPWNTSIHGISETDVRNSLYAPADRASICQIGMVHVRDGQIEDRWQTLVNPEDWFDPWNTSIHGISETDVRNSLTLPEVRDELRARLRGSVLVSHTSFDRVQRGASTSHSGITTRLKTPNKTRPRARARKKSAAPSAQTERTAGATIEELADATGWQKHSVHGALSRLRSAGFAIRLELTVGRQAYRLAPAGA